MSSDDLIGEGRLLKDIIWPIAERASQSFTPSSANQEPAQVRLFFTDPKSKKKNQDAGYVNLQIEFETVKQQQIAAQKKREREAQIPRGTLNLGPLSAQLKKDDKDWFGKQDPFFKYSLLGGGAKKPSKGRSKVHNDGGKQPKWNDVYKMAYNGEDQLKIEIFDEDTGKADQYIGTALIKNLKRFLLKGQQKDIKAVILDAKNKNVDAGTLTFSLHIDTPDYRPQQKGVGV